MKKLALTLTIVLVGSASAQQGTMPAHSSPAPASQPPSSNSVLAGANSHDPSTRKSRELLEKMIAALGSDAYLSYSSMTQEGRSYSFWQGQPNSAGVRFWRFWHYPDKDRVELTKQRDVIYIYNGDNGYELTFKGTAKMDAKELDNYLRARHYSMESITRVWLKDPATLILYSGTAIADQNLVNLVTLVNKNNESVTIGIDPNTNLPLKKTFDYRDSDGLKSTDDEIFANYRLIQGIQTPLTISRFHNGMQTGQRFLSVVQYNVPIPDSMFEAKATYDMYKLPPKKK